MNVSRIVSLFSAWRNQLKITPEVALAANAQLNQRYDALTGVFAGATHGIGLATLEAFIKHIPRPKAFVVGRNEIAFQPELQRLRRLNSQAELIFIQADLSLIQNIDSCCNTFAAQVSKESIDLLFMSQGFAPLGGRTFTKEGLDEAMTVCVYGRLRLAQQFLHKQMMYKNGVIITALAGGHEGNLFKDDLELVDNYAITNLKGHFSAITTLTFDELSKQHGDMGFIHVDPGTVNTGILTRGLKINPFLLWLFWIFERLSRIFGMAPAICGEWMLWLAANDDFRRGSYSLSYNGKTSSSEALVRYRKDEALKNRVSTHLEGLYDRALSNHFGQPR